MLKTREVFGYTLNTGRDLFDDLEQLDRHEALSSLGRKNNVGFYLSVILEGLHSVGLDVDELDFEQITAKTYEPAEHEKEQDKQTTNNKQKQQMKQLIIKKKKKKKKSSQLP